MISCCSKLTNVYTVDSIKFMISPFVKYLLLTFLFVISYWRFLHFYAYIDWPDPEEVTFIEWANGYGLILSSPS